MPNNSPYDELGFIAKTNKDYIEWCATFYSKDALDERGMQSLHGLWAWQEQERRFRTRPGPDAFATPQPDLSAGKKEEQGPIFGEYTGPYGNLLTRR